MAKCTNARQYKIQQLFLVPPECLLNTLFQRAKCSSVVESSEAKTEENTQRKILNVAILGMPNSGKSTLINQIIKLNVCDISCKTHTTQIPLRAAYVSGNTQIVFVDTPGIIVKKEFRRFKLSDSFVNYKKKVMSEVDVIGIIYDGSFFKKSIRLHNNLKRTLEEIPESKTLILLINKIDLVNNKSTLLEVERNLIGKECKEDPNKWIYSIKRKFDKIFFISALKDYGVTNVVNYLLEKAKPGEWLLGPEKIFDIPLHVLVQNLLRAEIMNVLPYEIPYSLKFFVEYLEENDLGEYICVASVVCKKKRQMNFIIKQKNLLHNLSKTLESNLYRICKKVFKLRVVVKT